MNICDTFCMYIVNQNRREVIMFFQFKELRYRKEKARALFIIFYLSSDGLSALHRGEEKTLTHSLSSLVVTVSVCAGPLWSAVYCSG